jgi:uncharacterized protein (TIGR02145 family)
VQPKETNYEGVEINGVIWAKSNVGKPGEFVENPEDYGELYTWEEALKVCPDGWRLPNDDERMQLWPLARQNLYDVIDVNLSDRKSREFFNRVEKYIEKTGGIYIADEQLFFPYHKHHTGYAPYDNFMEGERDFCVYWSNIERFVFMIFNWGPADFFASSSPKGHVRCVR